MKHLDYWLWAEINKTVEQELMVNDALLSIENDFESAKKLLNKKFLKIFEIEDRFHDMSLVGYRMQLKKTRNDYVLEIEIEVNYFKNLKPSYIIFFKNVEDVTYKHTSQVMEKWARIPKLESFGTWMYSEIYSDKGFIVFNIALAGGGEINIKCKNVNVDKV